jgi:hypothetical protein
MIKHDFKNSLFDIQLLYGYFQEKSAFQTVVVAKCLPTGWWKTNNQKQGDINVCWH